MSTETEIDTIVEYFYGPPSGHRCGYCRNTTTSISQGMWAHKMSVRCYQDLIDRGWRRSGKYCYKPLMDKTCCPQYTIKCDALQFKASKSQKKVIKRVNKYLNTGVKSGDYIKDEAGMGCSGSEAALSNQSEKLQEKVDVNQQKKPTDSASDLPVNQCTNEKVQSPPKDNKTTPSEKSSTPPSDCKETPMDTKQLPTPGKGADPNKPKCKKAKALRLEKKLQKQASSPPTNQDKPVKNTEKTLQEFLSDVSDNPAHKLEIRLVRSSPRSQEFNDSFDEAYAVYKKYQMTIHKDPPDKPSRSQYTRFLVDSPLQVRLVRSNPRSKEFQETFSESHKVFEKYQMVIHKDDPDECDQASFLSFLVESPLQEEHDDKLPHGYGSFHQQYLLDGKIIAVGVVDILPESISSVYLYYDPDFAFLCPGTYSALRETDFTCHLNSLNKNVRYYYMGYYIHSCPKMRYKGNYKPSYLLCPEVYSWHPYEECAPKLDAAKYSRFAPPGKEDTNLCRSLMNVGILWRRQSLNYSRYKSVSKADDEREVQEYANYAGEKCANAMLLYRSY